MGAKNAPRKKKQKTHKLQKKPGKMAPQKKNEDIRERKKTKKKVTRK